jgi:SAM-dependent methyltransferase
LVSKDGLGLEVGPSHQPYFTRAAGYNVEILDHASAEDLRRHYAAMGHDISRIEEVNYVSDGRPMHEVIPHSEHYDYIFAAHVIEHVSDFLGFFKSCERLLKPTGVVILAAPDKRFCFDVFQPLSTTGRVLDAHFHGRSDRHSPGKVYDHFSNIAVLEGKGIWNEDDAGSAWFANDLANSYRLFKDAGRPDGAYIDIHAWHFTITSFRLLIRDLNELALLTLRERVFSQSEPYEFVIVLDKVSVGCNVPRIELLTQVQREVKEGLAPILTSVQKHS